MKITCSNPIKVLIVDQDPDYFELMQSQIELNSHLFKIACKHIDQISEAADSISDWNPNLVVLDFANSPLQAAYLVKGCQQLELPVVITGDINNKEVQSAVEKIGAKAYVVKSDDPEELEKVLELFSQTAREDCYIH